MGAREALKVLQGQFEHAAKEFPGMMHIMAQRAKDGMYPIIPGAWKGSPPQQRSKDGMYPIVPDGLDSSRYCLRAWDKNLYREPDERGYPAWHWLRAPFFQQWDMQVVTDRFDILAKETGEIVAALDDSVLPISKAKLWVRRPAEYWVLLLHHFKLKPHWTIVNHEGTCTSTKMIHGLFGVRPVTFTHKTLLGGKEETRLAKEGESHIYWLDDVFLASALALGELLSKMPQPPTGGKAKDGAVAEVGGIRKWFRLIGPRISFGLIILAVLESPVMYGAACWGEGDNVWQKILKSWPFFCASFAIWLILLRIILGKDRWQHLKFWKGDA